MRRGRDIDEGGAFFKLSLEGNDILWVGEVRYGATDQGRGRVTEDVENSGSDVEKGAFKGDNKDKVRGVLEKDERERTVDG